MQRSCGQKESPLRPLEETKEWAELSTLPIGHPKCNGKQSAFTSEITQSALHFKASLQLWFGDTGEGRGGSGEAN